MRLYYNPYDIQNVIINTKEPYISFDNKIYINLLTYSEKMFSFSYIIFTLYSLSMFNVYLDNLSLDSFAAVFE